MGKIKISGNLLGLKKSDPKAHVVHVTTGSMYGPAENSFVLVDQSGRARYIPWIGYFDVEYARSLVPLNWEVIEPGKPYERECTWSPYGLQGDETVPNIGDRFRVHGS